MAKRADYSELVAQAENAVAGVKDPELKRIAFQKILDDLIADGTPAKSRKTASSRKARGITGPPKRAPRGGPQAYVEELVAEDFFRKQKTIAQVKAELENRGHHIPLTSLSGPLQKLCQRKVLRRQRAKTSGKKQTFAYSRW
ncbi:MAG: hypothetical protein QY320_08270 [Gammaproteobacteria bacterium]|nr:MAG: hypothetical protein QY320_08270 [Gammaproteobacteria bacterium]